MNKAQYAVAENVAAIALEFGAHEALRMRAYNSALADSDGFVGFYQVAIEAGEVLEKVGGGKRRWGDEFDWIATTERYANQLLTFMVDNGHLPSRNSLIDIAKKSLVRF